MTFNELKESVYISKVECFKDYWQVISRQNGAIILEGSKERIKDYLDTVLERAV